jgi:hypothetical protein
MKKWLFKARLSWLDTVNIILVSVIFNYYEISGWWLLPMLFPGSYLSAHMQKRVKDEV